MSLASCRNIYSTQIYRKDRGEEFYAVIGSWLKDPESGLPFYDDNESMVRNIVVRNICHPFFSHLVMKNENELSSKAMSFNSLIGFGNPMLKPYDTPERFLREILSRACQIYFQYPENTEKALFGRAYEAGKEIENGFLYMPELLSAFDRYSANRGVYKTFEDFMPEIIKVQNSFDPQQKYNEIEALKPNISVKNIENNSIGVDYKLSRIVLKFDKPMFVLNSGTAKGNATMPEITKTQWNKKGTELTLFVKLKPDTEYQILFPRFFFRDSQRYLHPKATYTLTFKTKKAMR